MTLFDQISLDIQKAMKAKDKVRLETLRNIKKEFLEAKTAPGSDGTLSDAKGLKIIQKLVKQGKDDAQLFQDHNRQSLADESMTQVKVMEEYLPKQMSESAIEEKVKEIMTRLGASSMKDMGKVMKEANQEMAGQAEGRVISGIVRKLLA
ncbi:MAG: GatB/YqeY domain-containing protein [Prevotella sp.]|jgi:uncharacterized protein YqeY|nr:GatB/YqeY domain-containing protein [Prevotella sp.]MCH4019217.1 GatB/YqeY domain-containing protein [Prevotella sp.]MCH4099194.1 GatB/YqeY domain-containing protein [Prevotella sp.]MCH4185991.1 GatB/YqeY domain-containing protein [Prevotella sp.]MCH4215920.1 GatB/YqeY domain-containing protein [Prevotella sp.]